MNQFGHNFRLAIWGESHGQQIGISIDGIPAGVPLSAEQQVYIVGMLMSWMRREMEN